MASGETALRACEGDISDVLVGLLMHAQGCSRAGTYSLVPSQGLSAPVMVMIGSNRERRTGF